ncbi:zinc-binding alcohol dehydrogenase family protein [Herbiconiux liukaitaii]|uniref:zinc-binding alcohol dehydrogenase family protein n=1 Tax=Herbiconiux liukaitaii TaxID=3342799 RepID=UPI0035B9B8FC
MHAAVVTRFDESPRYLTVPEPAIERDDQIVVEVLASALHPRVRSQADGAHYTATGVLPLVPGVDGIGRDGDGALRYFVVEEGAMAERAVIDRRASVVLPDGLDPVTLAAAMNPAMSSWIALRRRIVMPDRAHVLILGAAGNAGRLAIGIARHLGAARVSAVARDASRFAALTSLGADDVLLFDEVATAAAADVVLDYVWGPPAGSAMTDLVRARSDRSLPLTWVQIGSIAGQEAPIPSSALRSSSLQLVGSGQGSVSTRDIIAELPALAEFVSSGVDVTARAVPLHAVAETWAAPPTSADRIVFVP